VSAFDYASDIRFIELSRDLYIQKLTPNNYYAVLARILLHRRASRFPYRTHSKCKGCLWLQSAISRH